MRGPLDVGPVRAATSLLVGVVLLVAGCADDTPEVPVGPDGVPDPVLVLGRQVYSDRCANCHGGRGGGDRGPKISEGSTLEEYPEIVDQIAFVQEGEGLMPGFDDLLSESELRAVVRFVREVL